MSNDHDRAEFERWARAMNEEHGQGAFGLNGLNSPGGWYYNDDETQAAWSAWQARAAKGVVVAEGVYDDGYGFVRGPNGNDALVPLPYEESTREALHLFHGKRIRLVAEKVEE